jgi:hypothetical protein
MVKIVTLSDSDFYRRELCMICCYKSSLEIIFFEGYKYIQYSDRFVP